MEIRIGIVNSPRELGFETSQAAADIEKAVADVLDSDAKYLKLTDEAGKLYIVPTSSIGYLELGTEKTRRIGFVG